MMKADVLSIFPVIKICTKYQLEDGTITEFLPYELTNVKIRPIYAEMKGWSVPLSGVNEKNIPGELSAYISFLEKELGVPITLISTGPDRTQTIYRS